MINATKKADAIEGRVAQVAETLSDLKLVDIVVLDLRSISDFTDFFVIATAGSAAQSRAAVNRVLRRMREEGVRPFATPDDHSDTWNVLDYGDLVVHVFDKETREHYRLEDLWGDAKEFDWEAVPA